MDGLFIVRKNIILKVFCFRCFFLNCTMSMLDNLVAILTILTSLLLVLVIIGTAWWLMWKVNIFKILLSKHEL